MFNSEEIHQYSNLELLASQVVEGFITGLHKSPYHGFSVEFAEHRLYNSGESTRHIDWKLFGRTDKLFVKRYEEETNLRCQLVLDVSPSMYYPKEQLSKLKFSVYAAAALVFLLKKQRDAAGLTLFDENIRFHSQARSSTVNQKLIFNKLDETLTSVPESGGSKIASTLHEIAETIHKRSLVVIFSDMLEGADDLEEVFGALQHLRFCKHEVILFHTSYKPLEMDFEFSSRPYQFVDMETGEKLKLNPAAVKEAYKTRMQDRLTQLGLKCSQYRIDLVEADCSQGFDQVLLPFFRKRMRLM